MAHGMKLRLVSAAAGLVLGAGTALVPVARGAAYAVGTASIRLHGNSTQVLTDGSGMTLYYLATDTPTRSTCTGRCAEMWPPFVSGTAAASDGPLGRQMRVVKTDNGYQVSYNGHLLYRYSGDAAPGQANGDGVAGRWWVARIDLQPGAASSGSGAPAVEHRESGGGAEGGMGGGGMGH